MFKRLDDKTINRLIANGRISRIVQSLALARGGQPQALPMPELDVEHWPVGT